MKRGTDFILRHPLFAASDPRRAYKTRKNMNKYGAGHTTCEWTRHPTWKVQIHHIKSINRYPHLAADPDNFCSLAARNIHLGVGHDGNNRNEGPHNLKELIELKWSDTE